MEITLLQWNKWYESIDNVMSFLKANDADIICLQELQIAKNGSYNKAEAIGKLLDRPYKYAPIPLELGDDNIANAIYSKFPIRSSTEVIINDPGGKWRLRRYVPLSN